jgi:hypothetical protein
VDPLSRLPRAAPTYISPTDSAGDSIAMENDLGIVQETWLEREPAKRATFVAWTMEECLEQSKSVFAVTRSKRQGDLTAAEVTVGNDATAAGGDTLETPQ